MGKDDPFVDEMCEPPLCEYDVIYCPLDDKVCERFTHDKASASKGCSGCPKWVLWVRSTSVSECDEAYNSS